MDRQSGEYPIEAQWSIMEILAKCGSPVRRNRQMNEKVYLSSDVIASPTSITRGVSKEIKR
jgi:hypothetical protein